MASRVIHGETEDRSQSDLGSSDFLRQVKRWFRDDAEASSKWREEAEEDFRFFAGDQWDDEAKRLLKEQMRPCITFNRVLPVIKTVSGSERNNRQEVRYIPRTLGDAKVNEVFTAAAAWARDVQYADEKESDAFLDLLQCGMGWTEEWIDTTEDPEGKPAKEKLDPLEMYWDCNARERNLRDAKRKWRVRDVPLSDARDMFGDLSPEELHAAWARNWMPKHDAHDADLAKFYLEDQSGKDDNPEPEMVTIVQFQWKERKTCHRIVDPTTGEMAELSVEEYENLSRLFKKNGLGKIPSAKYKKWCYYQAFIGGEVLEKEESLAKKHFTFQCMTGERDHMNKTWFGLVRTMKDPQRWMNKFFSQILHIVNTTAIGGVMAEEGVFKDPRQAEKDWARPDKIAVLNAGSLSNNRIAPKLKNSAPPELFQLLEFSQTNVRDVVGVNLELMGMRDVNQPGVLEYQRKQAAMTVLATLFDNLRSYRKSVGEITLHYIQEYFSDGRLIRIVGEEGEQYVELRKIPGVVEFDVIVDEAPSAPNQKEQAWGVLQTMLPAVKDLMTPEMWGTILEYTPLPASLVEKFKQALSNAQQASQEQAQQEGAMAAKGMALEEAKLQADVEKTQADVEGKRIEQATKVIELQLEEQRAVQEQQAAEEQRGADMTMRMMDSQDKQADVQQRQQEAQNVQQPIAAITKALERLSQQVAELAAGQQQIATAFGSMSSPAPVR